MVGSFGGGMLKVDKVSANAKYQIPKQQSVCLSCAVDRVPAVRQEHPKLDTTAEDNHIVQC